ncbi:MAG: DUF6516 family protein [Candidatus Hydrothermarchaeaceae archaeon]
MTTPYERFSQILEGEFPDIVVHHNFISGKLRVHIIDESYLDIWFSQKLRGRFAYHWERRKVDGRIYRYDNRPHEELKHMKSYPKHFHNGCDKNVEESTFSDGPEDALRGFLAMMREKIKAEK